MLKQWMVVACLLPAAAWAQPAQWTPTPTNAAGTLLGTVTVGGAAAEAGDWVAAFDEGGICLCFSCLCLFVAKTGLLEPHEGACCLSLLVGEVEVGSTALLLCLQMQLSGLLLDLGHGGLLVQIKQAAGISS